MTNYVARPFVTAIIVAAGDSTRMGKVINKQMMQIGDKPVLAHAIDAFDKTSNINAIVVVCKKSDYKAISQMIEEYDFVKVCAVVEGGDYRQQSVFNGIEAAPQSTTHYAIHDGARAMIEPQHIHDVVNDGMKYKAATLGVRVKDTVKVIDDKNNIRGTVDRKMLYLTQTPQVFEKSIYQDGMRKAKFEDKIYSDDCQLIERLRLPIHMTIGSYDNIKITTVEDIVVAETILKKREELK